jgi:phage FluMu gp28-like protein
VCSSDLGAGLIWAIKLSEEWYRLHMPPLKAALEDDTIALIRDDEHLGDLRAVKLVRGIARIPALREGQTGKKRHGDHAIAVALAHFASRMRWVEYDYRAAGRMLERLQGRLSDYPQDEAQPSDGWWSPPLGADVRGGF